MSQVPAVGTDQSSGWLQKKPKFQNVLDGMIATFPLIQKLVGRLVPDQLWITQSFASDAYGKVYTINMNNQHYNGILVALTNGSVGLWFGAVNSSVVPDLPFSAVGNPVFIPFPARTDQQVQLQVTSGPATGKVHLICY